MSKRPTFGSLFSGIGGGDLGFERAGWECRFQVEIDDYCRRVLTKHWPDVPKFGDIKGLAGHELEPVDCIIGGFPCQSVSTAGKRRGQNDERWLWPEYIRIVRVVRPRYVVVENAPGLLSLGMSDVLGELAASGFDAEWATLSAATFGASHIRERVFVVAHRERIRQYAPSAFACKPSQCPDKPRVPWQKDGAVLSADAGGRVWCFPDTDPNRGFDGFPDWMDRLKGLGNAQVPQVVEWIGRRIIEVGA